MSVVQAGNPNPPASQGVGAFSETPKLIKTKVGAEHLCEPAVSNSHLAVETLQPVLEILTFWISPLPLIFLPL